MVYRSSMDVPTRYQWDPDSRLPLPDPGTAAGNCGITCATVIEQFYNDAWHGIYANRRLVTSSLELSSTIGQQSQILWKRNVPNVIDKQNLAGLHSLMRSQLRPVMLGMDFSKVPYDIAGHPFRGSHSIMLRANAAGGFIYLDPNFNRTYRQDPKKGYRFMPDWVVNAAYYNVATQWAVIPTKDKLIPTFQGRVRAHVGAQIRTDPYQGLGTVWATARSDGYTYAHATGRRLWANTYQYYWNGHIAHTKDGDYYSVKTHDGRRRFIRTGAATITRPA